MSEPGKIIRFVFERAPECFVDKERKKAEGQGPKVR